jgi:hypothetical protein
MPAQTEAETELAALERIAAAVEEHDLAGLIEKLEAERPNLSWDGRSLRQLNNLLTVAKGATAAFTREKGKREAELAPPPETQPVRTLEAAEPLELGPDDVASFRFPGRE